MRLKALSQPVKRVHYGPKGSDTYYDVAVVPMSVHIAAEWHAQVQPLIDRLYSPWQGSGQPGKVRADVTWDWTRNLLLAQAYNSIGFNRSPHPAFAWSLVLRSEDGADQVPIGMLTVAPQFHATLAGPPRDRAFVWYLADAPVEFYQHLQIEEAHGVASALVDTAIQTRLDLLAGIDASTFLHADPAGGPRLIAYYSKHGMTRVMGSGPRVSLCRPFKTGEYFLMDDPLARSFCARLNPYR